MGNLLYLVHRLPYPPNKGDKVRSYHLLKHLAANHRVFLGTFVDDPADEVHLPTVKAFCADMHAAKLNPTMARIGSLVGLLTGEALTMRYYRNAGLTEWVKRVVEQNKIDAIVVFSSAMGQYADEVEDADDASPQPLLVDFVDVDSAKWTQYAANHRWPMSWVYQREGQRLLDYERALAMRSQRSFFVTENETALFRQLAPECSEVVAPMSNGVDADYFSPEPNRISPFPSLAQLPEQPASPVIVFTGAMDYWPNVDAVTWFAADILPRLQQLWPALRFYIVGRTPSPAVLALASAEVIVTGTVDDVRPYLQYATVVVAPLRVARGIQNKILEAMAMGRPVVASQSCVDAIDDLAGGELVSASSAEDFVKEVNALLGSAERCSAMGQAGRNRVLQSYSWFAHLSKIDRYLEARSPAMNSTKS